MAEKVYSSSLLNRLVAMGVEEKDIRLLGKQHLTNVYALRGVSLSELQELGLEHHVANRIITAVSMELEEKEREERRADAAARQSEERAVAQERRQNFKEDWGLTALAMIILYVVLGLVSGALFGLPDFALMMTLAAFVHLLLFRWFSCAEPSMYESRAEWRLRLARLAIPFGGGFIFRQIGNLTRFLVYGSILPLIGLVCIAIGVHLGGIDVETASEITKYLFFPPEEMGKVIQFLSDR
jgi:hypothetical protein